VDILTPRKATLMVFLDDDDEPPNYKIKQDQLLFALILFYGRSGYPNCMRAHPSIAIDSHPC
jgi:hypothetical protein